jgi:hypothetical protein
MQPHDLAAAIEHYCQSGRAIQHRELAPDRLAFRHFGRIEGQGYVKVPQVKEIKEAW